MKCFFYYFISRLYKIIIKDRFYINIIYQYNNIIIVPTSKKVTIINNGNIKKRFVKNSI